MVSNLYKILLINILCITQVQSNPVVIVPFCVRLGSILPTEYGIKVSQPYNRKAYPKECLINLAYRLKQWAKLGYKVICLHNADNTDEMSKEIHEYPNILLAHVRSFKFYDHLYFQEDYQDKVVEHVESLVALAKMLAIYEVAQCENTTEVICADPTIDPESEHINLKEALVRLQTTSFCSGIIDPAENGIPIENIIFMLRLDLKNRDHVIKIFNTLYTKTFNERMMAARCRSEYLYLVHVGIC